MRDICYSEAELDSFFKENYKAIIIEKKRVNLSVYILKVNRIPKNNKPAWIWFALRYKKTTDWNTVFHWRFFCLTEEHLNGLKDAMPLFFEWYDKDNKNLRLVPRFDNDTMVIKQIKED
jgi:hypothetical protein